MEPKRDSERKLRVLVVDDSAFYRQTFSGMLRSVKHIEVMGVVSDGLEAMRFLAKHKPDVITLDLEMPRMDGFTLLRWLMANNPLPVVVVSSRAEKTNVFKALELGAVDFVAKPTHRASLDVMKIQKELLSKVETASGVRIDKVRERGEIPSEPVPDSRENRAPGEKRVRLVAIGASTGGPPAIERILHRIPDGLSLSVVVAQHMPPVFTQYFADRLDRVTHLRVKEGEHNETVKKSTVYIAPGGHHMRVNKEGDRVYLTLESHTGRERYVPSVDILLESAAEVYGSEVIGVLLTGMGRDGKEGMRHIKKNGGVTVAESEETAVIFGMPKEAIVEGVVDKVLALNDIPSEIVRRCS